MSKKDLEINNVVIELLKDKNNYITEELINNIIKIETESLENRLQAKKNVSYLVEKEFEKNTSK